MKKEEDKVYINGRYEIKFIGLIKTWGKRRVEGKYDVISDEEIIHLHLQLYEGSSNCMSMRNPSLEECKEGFIKNKEDQEKFFKVKGKELIKKALITDKTIVRILKNNAIPEEAYLVTPSHDTAVIFKGKSKR